jgi:hypothetical protein
VQHNLSSDSFWKLGSFDLASMNAQIVDVQVGHKEHWVLSNSMFSAPAQSPNVWWIFLAGSFDFNLCKRKL